VTGDAKTPFVLLIFLTSALMVCVCYGVGCGSSPSCGDGVVDQGEECDEGQANSDTVAGACRTSCRLPHCGDGIVDDGESCDDGEQNSEATPDACRRTCEEASCGDGVVDSAETCDDGDEIDGDECNNACSEGVLWTRSYAGPNGGNDFALGIAIDAEGQPVVVGGSEGRALVRRYSAQGDLLWSQGESVVGAAVAAAIDVDGTIVVSGVLVEVSETDVWVRKYDSDGDVLWTRTHGGAASGDDNGQGVAIDEEGNIIVVGGEGIAQNDSAVWVRKYNAMGDEIWTRTYDGSGGGEDEGRGVAVLPGGDIVVVGYEALVDADGDGDGWVRKYDADGAVLWTRTYDGSASGDDEANAASGDGNGGVLVLGSEAVMGTQSVAWIRKYSAEGAAVWTENYRPEDTWVTRSYGVAVDSQGDIFACGYHAPTEAESAVWIAKYDLNGTHTWSASRKGPGSNALNLAGGIVVDSEDHIVIAGSEDIDDGLHQDWDIWIAKLVTP